MSTVALLVITDRPEYLERTLLSAAANLPGFDQYIEVEDQEHMLGFGGAIAEGWRQVDTEYVVHLEDDWLFNRPAPVGDMVAVLEADPALVQIALLRQPWSPEEKEAGGIVQLRPETYALEQRLGHPLLTHRNFVTTNPAVWPRWVIDRGWPDCAESEGHFGIDLFASDPDLRAAFWGSGEEWVTHIGEVRCGVGY